MEKNGFCDEGCGTELTFWDVFLYSIFFWRICCWICSSLGTLTFFGKICWTKSFWTLTFSGEYAAEYAANSGLLRKRRPSSPPIFGRGGEKPPPIPKWEGRREASSSPPVFSRVSRDRTFFGKICWKRTKSKGEKIIENGAKMIRRV